MERPSVERLPLNLARAARLVAGHRAWLVGGAVRDLALGVTPKDADLASAATPDELARLFPATFAVGKAFGTVVVHTDDADVQVTTFRLESGYDDARRPTHVAFGTSLEEDAARRDFTCNALYLDPLTDELVDPTGGLADLAEKRLRCVGDPRQRFAEDGLRLLRVARLAAEHGLAVDAETRAGARGSLEALRGVSAERELAELERMAAGADPARALRLLHELGVLARVTGVAALGPPPLERRVEAVERLARDGPARVLATLFRPADPAQTASALAALLELRPARELSERVRRTWALEGELVACLDELARGDVRRARAVRLLRAAEQADALAVWTAWHPEERAEERRRLASLAERLGHDALWPAPLVTSADLARAGVPRGPRWGELLRAAEDAQLDGELTDAESARAWLERRAQ
jgi:tRNA nucleotidyltransferase/poly(A) polymerase